MARLFARMFALVLGISAFAVAEAQTYKYTFYVGNTNSNGCTVQTPAGAVNHVKWRLQTTVTGGAAPSVGAFTRADCSNNVFGAATAVSSTSAVGLNTAPGGLDVIEAQLPVGVVGPTPSPREILAVVATSSTGSDGLIASVFAKGAADGATKGIAVPDPIMIPTAGVYTLALLGLALGALAWRTLRRRGHLLMLSMVLIAGSAWAVAIVVDGQVGDWAGVTGNGDAAGDSSSGQAAIDLRALYVTTQGGNGYVRVDVTDLENPPVANPGSANVLEDGNVAITLTGTDPNNAPLTFQIAGAPTLGTLGAITPINASSASVTYTPNADESGSDSFTFTVSNGTQTSTPATVSITIAPVNDAPSFSAANPPAANEGAGAQSVPGWATFDAGPANEASQGVLAYHVSNISAPALFAVAPSVDASGTLSYTLAAEASGSASFDVAVQDDGGTANGGIDTSATQSFTLTVNAVNDAPVFSGGGNAAALEDAGAQNVIGWATGIDDGDADQVQALAFQVTGNTNAALFAAGPAVDAATGTLSFTPAADANGSATLTLVLGDDGGTANGGVDTSAAYVFDISVGAVNDAPSFTAVDPPAVNEGAGAQSVPNWATFSPGPANEAGQAVAEYQVSAIGNPGLFSAAPSVAADGTLNYTVAANVSGSSTFSVAVRDDGGTANGGVDLSTAQVFTLTVNAVNSAPTFVGGGDVASNEDAGAQTVAGWATAIDDGDLDQVQALAFTVTGNTNPALFSAGPSVDAGSGDLTYTAAAETSGSATITLVLTDDGGTANGGSDTSAPYVFTITVNAVNDAPTATPKSHVTHSAIELEIVAASHTGELLEGAADPDDPIGELTAEYVAGSATPTGAQVVVTNAADGSFRYDPPGGYTGAGSFQYRVCDDGVPQQCSAPTTVTFEITGPDLYFVDDGAADGGDGGLNDPFDAISDLPPARGSDDRIFVFAGTYPAAAHAFLEGEHLIGQGATGTFDTVFGVSVPGNGALDARPTLTGLEADRPALDRIVMAAAHDAVLRGVALSSGTADAVSIVGSNAVTVAETSAASSAGGVSIDGASASAAGVSFSSVSSTGGTNGIALNDLAGPGAFDFGTGSLSGNSGVAFLGTGTLATTSYAGDIAKTSAGNLVELAGVAAATDTGSVTLSGTLACSGSCAGIDVLERDAGTVTFSGSSKTLSTGANAAVRLDNNDGAAIHFTGGGLAIATTSGAGFDAVNGAAAVSVQGAGNTIATGSGIALNVAGTAIGADDLTFQSIASNGASSGIVLSSTGNAGGLTVTGTGTAGSGGTIQNGATGVLLANTRDVSLTGMQLNDFSDFAIRGTSVVNFALADSVVSGSNGDDAAADEGSVRFNELTGAASVTNSSISGSVEHNMQVVNTAGLLDRLTVTGSTFGSMNPVTGSDGLTIETLNTAVINATVQNNAFTHAIGDHFQFTGNGSTANDVVFGNNTVSNSGVNAVPGGGGVRIFGGNNSGTVAPGDDVNASLTFDVIGNTVRDARGSALAVNKLGGSGAFAGVIEGNAVGLASVANSGSAEGSAISVLHDFGGAHTVAIRDNTVRQYANFGIYAQAGGSGILGSGALNATVTGNVVSDPGSLAFIKNGAHLNGGVTAGDSYSICYDLGGAAALANSLVGSGDDGGPDFRLRHRQSTTIRLPGYPGAAFDVGAVVAFEQARNTGAETGQAATSGLGGGFVGGAACPQP